MKISSAIKTEALRLARKLIKEEIKASGFHLSNYDAKDITKAAIELVKRDPAIVKRAKANLEHAKANPIRLLVAKT